MCTVPLNAPYVLSFRQLDSYEAVRVRIEDHLGVVGWGEAVALPGYGDERTEDIVAGLSKLQPGAEEVVIAQCAALGPFAASAARVALEIPAWLAEANRQRFVMNRGPEYLKVKVGMNPLATDIDRALTALEGRAKVVFDANQAHTLDEALEFAAAIAGHGNLLWYEQPGDRNDWKSMATLAAESSAPIVLDECIHGAEEIDRAAALGVHGVKLKLCKHPGMTAVRELALRARRLGLAVVFGNGVATEYGNLAEYLLLCALPETFAKPAECSGFTRTAAVSVFGLTADDGYLNCQLDGGALQARMKGIDQ